MSYRASGRRLRPLPKNGGVAALPDTEKYYTVYAEGKYGPRVVETWAVSQILEAYYPIWRGIIDKKGVSGLGEKECIEDWVIVNWAFETDRHGNKL